MEDLLHFWFPNCQFQEFWFDGSKDYEIQEKFGTLLKQYEENEFTSNNILGKIILFDQITRNISRLEKTDFRRNDTKALELAKSDVSNDMCYSLNQRIFLLLPFRHSRTTENLDFVISRLRSYPESN